MLLIFSVNVAVAYALHNKRRLIDCPIAGFITYENKQAGDCAQSFTSTRVEKIDNCYRECLSRSECGFLKSEMMAYADCSILFYLRVTYDLIDTILYTLRFTCEGIENATEASTKAPTEAPIKAPTEAKPPPRTAHPKVISVIPQAFSVQLNHSSLILI